MTRRHVFKRRLHHGARYQFFVPDRGRCGRGGTSCQTGSNVDQYRSLIINGASPLFRASDGSPEDLQQAGAGVMNVISAIHNTVTALPTSLTFGLGNGTLGGATTGHYDQLTLTNIGTVTDTYTITSIAYDVAGPLEFSVIPDDMSPASTLQLTINPGQSKTLYAYWTSATRLPAGQYQGQISVIATKAPNSIVVPYWYGVPNGIPDSVFLMDDPPTEAKVGGNVYVFVRVTDFIGYPITSTSALGFKSKVLSGGGSITLTPTVYYPGIRLIQLTLGKTAGNNMFEFSFGNLDPIEIGITGVTLNNGVTMPAPVNRLAPPRL